MRVVKLILDAYTRRYFDFTGRSGAREWFACCFISFWLSAWVNAVGSEFTALYPGTVWPLIISEPTDGISAFIVGLQLIVFIPTLAITVRRLRDIGLSFGVLFIWLIFEYVTEFVHTSSTTYGDGVILWRDQQRIIIWTCRGLWLAFWVYVLTRPSVYAKR